MMLIVLLLQVSLVNCVNITENTLRIKSLIMKYKNNRVHRSPMTSLDGFVQDALMFFDRTERFKDVLNVYNYSECVGDEGLMEKHVLKGLIIHEHLPRRHWHEYKAIHNKLYSSTHHEMAALIKWRQNLRRVARHNREYLAGIQSYSLHLNHFGDMHVTEYFGKVLKLIKAFPLFDPAEDHHKTAYRHNRRCKVPKRIDWRDQGFKPRREEQWQCGACYAFAVTHALQAQLYKRHGEWNELSPQQIVDCSIKDGNMGCDGGSLRGALRYAAREGLVMESHYPYVGKKGYCRYDSNLVRARPRRWATLPSGDEEAMEKALATVGPLAVAVNAAPFTFQLYRSGVYDDPFCVSWHLNHAMLLIGYTQDYWILLNWWGRNWGEDGYMRIRRGLNRCGVANMATYVEL
ncbi:cathepsin L1-like [Bombyx mandarina]|uniref:Cathepsin L1-like n=1 Tax=Bombyx mandarina TaxID=7092 RepID=A0A6J2KTK0_BOMMA|nr:cathepsin L1-like [Bombyx mandarina]